MGTDQAALIPGITRQNGSRLVALLAQTEPDEAYHLAAEFKHNPNLCGLGERRI